MQAASLYLHVPFCEVKCHYCDFYSLAAHRTPQGAEDQFVEALRKELQQEVNEGRLAPVLKTCFLGGGTPSRLEPAQWARIWEPLQDRWTGEGEWTLEANPGSLSLEKVKGFRQLGINRLSIGVQALQDDVLKALGRAHGVQEVWESLAFAAQAGFENVSVDLLCGLPGQTVSDLERTLGELLARFPLTHLSCYLLTLPPHHPWFHRLPPPEEQTRHYLAVHDFFKGQGWEHYEISNYARPGYQAQHNLAYWQGKAYLGVGPSAHSYDSLQGKRWKKVSSLHRYLEALLKEGRLPVEAEEVLTEKQKKMEFWMLSLRLQEGFSEEALPLSQRISLLQKVQEAGWIESCGGGKWRCTPSGWLLSEELVKLFVGTLDS